MRAHLTLAFGFLLAAIFAYRGLNAIADPGIGLSELYVLGGFAFSAWFIVSGLREMIARKRTAEHTPDS